MPTYLQLAQEPAWGAQFVPPVMNAGLLGPLRVFYGLGPSAVGSAGDNNHLYGRHRSYNWDRTSIYCTNRSYGTVDGRDQGGNRDWYRAVDVGIQGQLLFDASHRMDALARSGQCPGLAEWFGTYDGVRVVGWFEGRPAISDSSHLFHLHVGVWNSYANDVATMQQLYNTITGAGPVSSGKAAVTEMIGLRDPENGEFTVSMSPLSTTGYYWTPVVDINRSAALQSGGVTMVPNTRPGLFGPSAQEVRAAFIADLVEAVVDALPAGGGGGGGDCPTVAEIEAAVRAGVRAELNNTKLAAL